MPRVQFYVRPRYVGGSPAMVDERQAQRQASIERSFYDEAMREPVIDPEMTAKAKRLGLGGIVEKVYQTAHGWAVYDILTHRACYRVEKPAHKLEVGRDHVTHYRDEHGRSVGGRWRVIEATPGRKGTHRMLVRLEGKDVMVVHEDDPFMTEHDFAEGEQFRY